MINRNLTWKEKTTSQKIIYFRFEDMSIFLLSFLLLIKLKEINTLALSLISIQFDNFIKIIWAFSINCLHKIGKRKKKWGKKIRSLSFCSRRKTVITIDLLLRLITEFEHCENYFKVQGTQQSPEQYSMLDNGVLNLLHKAMFLNHNINFARVGEGWKLFLFMNYIMIMTIW